MVINVGLLVHHKINLQNSVDLAAYYGAMKQAEVMNAIAHINYQIRQSYKLLTWRYRVMGTAGTFPFPPGGGDSAFIPGGHPVIKDGPGVNNGVRGGRILSGEDYDGINEDPQLANFYWRPAFCVATRPFQEIPENESTCHAPEGQTIAALRIPPSIATFIAATQAAITATQLANLSMERNCNVMGVLNYLMLGKFVVSYQIDQADRKRLLYLLANGLSQSETDFRDLEGELASDGIRKTLENNLTFENKKSLQLEVFNSLGAGDCGQRGGVDAPPKWLAEVMIFPRASYKHCQYNAGSVYGVRSIEQTPDLLGPATQYSTQVQYIQQMLAGGSGTQSVYRHSLGVEKNPWCMTYVGVQATAEPELPFSLGKVRLKARAFAKPFGGRIGPWFGQRFPRQAAGESDSGTNANQIDRRLPIRCVNGNFGACTASGVANDEVTTVNYSRFPGDRFGLASRMVHADYSKSIFDVGKISFGAWNDIDKFPNARGGEWDILAFQGGDQPATKFRDLEISAVAPDIFDLTYYSIEPEFHKNYYKDRLEKYLAKFPLGDPRGVVRFDLGSRQSSEGFSIKDQMDVVSRIGGSSSPDSYGLNVSAKFKYLVSSSQNFAHTLTGWISNSSLVNYEFDSQRFGKCSSETVSTAASPGSCVRGGRTGYSVKIISSDYLLDNHALGGAGSAQEKILNQPPPNFVN